MNKTAPSRNSQRTRQFSKATARCLLLLTAVLGWLPPNDAVAEPTTASVKDNPAEHLMTAARALKQIRPELFGTAEGILVTLVVPDGQAAAAGLVPGDVLIGYSATPIDSVQQLTEQIVIAADDSRITLTYLHGEQRHRSTINGGAIGVGLQDLAETPFTRMIALLQLGQQALATDNYSEAVSLFGNGLTLAETQQHQQALLIHRQTGDPAAEAGDLIGIGIAYKNLNRPDEALPPLEQALTICRELGDLSGEGAALNSIGNLYRGLGRYREALPPLERALLIHRELGDRH